MRRGACKTMIWMGGNYLNLSRIYQKNRWSTTYWFSGKNVNYLFKKDFGNMFVSQILCHWYSLVLRFGTKREPFRPLWRCVQALMATRLRPNDKSLGKLFWADFIFSFPSRWFSARERKLTCLAYLQATPLPFAYKWFLRGVLSCFFHIIFSNPPSLASWLSQRLFLPNSA